MCSTLLTFFATASGSTLLTVYATASGSTLLTFFTTASGNILLTFFVTASGSTLFTFFATASGGGQCWPKYKKPSICILLLYAVHLNYVITYSCVITLTLC